MAILFDLGDLTNWELVWMGVSTATPLTASSYTPAPDLDCPILIDAEAIAVVGRSPEAKASWRSAGRLSRWANSAIPGAGRSVVDWHSVRLQGASIFHWDKDIGDYGLSFQPWYWLKSVEITIFEYVGPVASAEELALDELHQDLALLDQYVRGNLP